MTSNLLFRGVLTLGIISVGLFVYWCVNQRMMLKAQNNLLLLAAQMPNKPVIVYFTTPDCAPCKTVQRPALNQISHKLGEKVQVIEIDATEEPEIAKQWGVMSVPTTFLLDSKGKARFVNNGVTRAEKLMQQLQSL